MEPEITTKEFEVRFSDCDLHSRLKLSNLFLFMEETAIADAELNGFGLWKMMKAGYTTVITRIKLRILHVPVWGEKISISTWAKEFYKDKVCLKDYSILDARGNAIAQATSSWLLVNMKTGKSEKLHRTLGVTVTIVDILPFTVRACNKHTHLCVFVIKKFYVGQNNTVL